jgi:hypothetical protein
VHPAPYFEHAGLEVLLFVAQGFGEGNTINEPIGIVWIDGGCAFEVPDQPIAYHGLRVSGVVIPDEPFVVSVGIETQIDSIPVTLAVIAGISLFKRAERLVGNIRLTIDEARLCVVDTATILYTVRSPQPRRVAVARSARDSQSRVAAFREVYRRAQAVSDIALCGGELSYDDNVAAR